ncbi:MAG: alpha-ribazole phosphatase [Desulfobacterales bacterium]|nr:alpha-ribazole phosphatase [Desulfobacterales bacterium]
MPRLYLLRHGDIEWPEPDCFIGQLDVPLSAAGRRQARAWKSEFFGTDVAAVWSSDLQRATETAAIVFAGHRAGLRTCGDLREIRLGEWDGRPRRRVRDAHPDLWLARGQDLAGFRPPGGESFSDLQERVVRCVERIAADAAGDVCMVTHAGVIRVLICHCLQMPLANLFRIRLDYGSLSVVDVAPERVELRALNLKPLLTELPERK